MSRLVHYNCHVPADPVDVLSALRGDPRGWLGGQAIDRGVHVVALAPAGLLADAAELVPVRVEVGPVTDTDDGVLRRLSYSVDGLVPRTRCDLSATRSPGHGVQLVLQGEYRPRAQPAHRSQELAAAQSIAQPLIQRIAERAARATFKA